MDSFFFCIQDNLLNPDNITLIKEEMRALILLKLRLNENLIVLDIEAGKLGASIDIARLVANGFVYTIENNDNTIKMIRKNCEKFEIKNLQIIKDETPDAINELIGLDRVYIDADVDNFYIILSNVCSNLKINGKIVATSNKSAVIEKISVLLQEKNFNGIETLEIKYVKKDDFSFFIISAQKNK